VINTIFGPTRLDIKNLWDNIFEVERLDRKLDFMQSAIPGQNSMVLGDIRTLKQFIRQWLMPLRNKIVHGHEISETISSEGPLEKSQLSELLSTENIEALYKEFWHHLEIFLILFHKIIIPPGINMSPTFVQKDIIENTKEGLRRIEKELRESSA
jgi:hypothetical protein